MEVYPDARIILTVRDAESWYRSAQSTIFESMKQGLRSQTWRQRLRLDALRRRSRLRMTREIIVDGAFGGDLDDKPNAIAVYEANVARVHAEVPAHRLVVFDSKDGWAPLCNALDVPVPDVPYPRINTTQEFIERWRGGNPNREMSKPRRL